MANSTSDVINYTLVVTNVGNAAIANVQVSDPFTGNEAPVLVGGFNSGDTDQDNLLDVNETWHFTASHQVTQAELDAGTNIVNTATATGTNATPDDDSASVPVTQTKILHLEKDATVPGGTANVVGETISYTLAVTNLGNAAIANVQVSDPFTGNEAPVLVGGFNSGDTDQDNLLDVNETWHFTASHQVTQAELDAGTNIVNTATATGTGATPDDDDASVTVTQNRALGLDKVASVPGGTANVVGEKISYTLTVTNKGNAAIANVQVDDPFTTDEAPVLVAGFNSGDTDQDNLLDVGETWHFTASHLVTQAELNAGGNIANTATVTGDGAPSVTATALVPVVTGPSSLSGVVYLDFNNDGTQQAGERGIKSVKITLQKLIGSTWTTVATTFTNAYGQYSFKNLGAATYRIIETQPIGYREGKDTLGKVNGITRGTKPAQNQFQVTLAAGENGVRYYFGELVSKLIYR